MVFFCNCRRFIRGSVAISLGNMYAYEAELTVALYAF